jgi:hypothetical protein
MLRLSRDFGKREKFAAVRRGKPSNPAAILTPTWPCTLKGCNE